MTCEKTGPSGYREFSKRLHSVAAQRRIPVSGSWELTSRCNLRCAFCYLEGAARDAGAAGELTTAQIVTIAEELVEAGCMWLVITGGEPLLRADFAEVYEALARRGLLLTLCTNATLLTAALADVLASHPPMAVEVTLYGATAQTYDRVTGVAGSHADCHRGIDLLMERSIRLRLKTTVSALNVHEVEAMADQARALGVPFRFDAQLNPRVDGGSEPQRHRLTPEQVVQLEQRIPERREAIIQSIGECAAPESRRDELYHCGAGLTEFHIDATGRMGGCVLVRGVGEKLPETHFVEAWRQLGVLRRERWSREAECRECRWVEVCGQCPGWASIEGESSQHVVEHLCKITELRLQLIGKQRSDQCASDHD